ncbi:SNF2 family N-terminal domain-containing protein [Thelonectria olida]|uniref:SNF2 family N-terminal domain-containing protein n=1 Tax=Thelonectria olida TaxID=1576542 RepID=A0A9P8VTS6_9HYPO|nr:SNF2 family N-terminal domain-containing protein [Thelonectria olida]
MFAEGFNPFAHANAGDKRPPSPDFENAAKPWKKSCLQAVKTDPHEEVPFPLTPKLLPSIPQVLDEYRNGDVSWADIHMGWGDGLTPGDNTALAFDQTDLLASETLYDTCFGVVVTSATSSFFRGREATTATVPINMQPHGDFLKLYTSDTGKYAGIVTDPTLSRLLAKHSVKLSTFLIAPQSSKEKEKGKASRLPDPQCSLRVVVYGTMGERSEVGRLLSDAGLYLQHPSPEEVELEHVEYFNPHYLLRPGSQMPRLEDLTISGEDSTTASALNETTKIQLMSIFDTAGDLGIKPTTDPSPRIRSRLKQHQLTALAAMSEKECYSVESRQCPSLWEAAHLYSGETTYRHRITGQTTNDPPLIAGGILADEMGLGKTLSILSLICWSMDSLHDANTQARDPMSLTTLIVAPKSTITGWQSQIKKHILPGQIRVATYHGPRRQRVAAQFRSHDIILTTYQTLRSDWIAKGPLFSENWFRIVLDEAHRIGNRTAQTFHAACELQSPRRWCLTGTPIQNTLDNYGALLSFVRVAPFIEKSKFDHWISNRIRDDRPDGLPTLRMLIQATCLRRTKQSTAQSCELPGRSEKIEKVDLSPSDRPLYDFFQAETARIAAGCLHSENSGPSLIPQGKKNILPLINFLRLICNHGEDLLPAAAVEAWRVRQSGSISWQMMQSAKESCAFCRDDLESTSPALPSSAPHCGHPICASCSLQEWDDSEGMKTTCFACSDGPTPPFASKPSAKMKALIQNLQAEQVANQQGFTKPPVKSVVFSYWTKMLGLIETALQQSGISYERLDGQSTLLQRSNAMRKFADDPTCTVMLATIGSAGEGIDLTSASCVHLMEPHWNPMAEEQAIARVHRIGQLRHVTTTKYITPRSIEQYVQDIQKQKLQLVKDALESNGTCQREVDNERWRKLRQCLNANE